MIYIPIKSGLGNQMFGYAYSLYLQNKGYKTKFVWREYIYNDHHNGVELPKVFKKIKEGNEWYIKILIFFNPFFNKEWWPKWIIMKIFVLLDRGKENFIQTTPYTFDDFSFPQKDCIAKGYWQNYKYLTGIRSKLLYAFSVDKDVFENDQYYNDILNCQSVSIHVRRGDYLKPQNANWNVTTPSYYLSSIDIIKQKFPNCVFFVFSDDIDWCKNTFKGTEFIFVHGNKGIHSYLDLILMSLCKHNIISNSTFSWWAAWLNMHPDKYVICPYKWTNNGVLAESFCPSDWKFVK